MLHARALPDNPYDGHTLRDVIDRTETLTGCAIERAYVDKGYRGHDAQNPRRIFISGQKRGVFGVIKRELRRRSAIEPIIGHLKTDGHLGRCYLKGRAGDAANVILSAVGHNFRRILAWLRELLCLFLIQLWRTRPVGPRSIRLLNGRLAKVWRAAIHRSSGEFMQLPVKFAWQRTWSSREGCISLARALPCFTSPQSATIIIAPLDHRTNRAWRWCSPFPVNISDDSSRYCSTRVGRTVTRRVARGPPEITARTATHPVQFSLRREGPRGRAANAW